MRINYNVSAMITNNNLANNDSAVAKSLQRLSSGLKINSAKDNPAGLAMAKRMNAQLMGLSMANQNASDGVSIIETADGAMSEISEMLQRMNELAVKAANGVESDGDRDVIQKEINQLSEEINRVAETTEFNGQKLLNGEFSMKGYMEGKYTAAYGPDGLDIKVASYSSEVAIKKYELEITVTKPVPPETEYKAEIDPKAGFPTDVTATMKDKLLTIQGGNGFKMVLDLSGCDLDKMAAAGPQDITLDVEGIGGMRLQVGANEGQIIDINIPKISTHFMGLDEEVQVEELDENGKPVMVTKWMLDVRTEEKATAAIDRIDGAIHFITDIRGQLGAYQNRLESTINSLDVTSENMTAAYSRIMDVDMAEEMTNYTTAQVMTQAATSMLAQANERPSQVLQLLQ
ncbi:MAG: flagellin FliC3 [Lachnospiraceae bacterium]|nr:flagellin [uncultured Acetatifactor sp.]MCI9232332.1 flagellin FliC3 [Lachnospiraceae bacterium]